jgi:hypothetical protein
MKISACQHETRTRMTRIDGFTPGPAVWAGGKSLKSSVYKKVLTTLIPEILFLGPDF